MAAQSVPEERASHGEISQGHAVINQLGVQPSEPAKSLYSNEVCAAWLGVMRPERDIGTRHDGHGVGPYGQLGIEGRAPARSSLCLGTTDQDLLAPTHIESQLEALGGRAFEHVEQGAVFQSLNHQLYLRMGRQDKDLDDSRGVVSQLLDEPMGREGVGTNKD